MEIVSNMEKPYEKALLSVSKGPGIKDFVKEKGLRSSGHSQLGTRQRSADIAGERIDTALCGFENHGACMMEPRRAVKSGGWNCCGIMRRLLLEKKKVWNHEWTRMDTNKARPTGRGRLLTMTIFPRYYFARLRDRDMLRSRA